MNDTRLIGTIEDVYLDHDFDCVFVAIRFDGFSTAFGGLAALDAAQERKFLTAVARAAGVMVLYHSAGRNDNVRRAHETLKGRKIAALFNLGELNEHIEGVELPEGGNRLTITGFRRAIGTSNLDAFLDAKASYRNRLERDITSAERSINKAREKLATLDDRWADWGDGDPL